MKQDIDNLINGLIDKNRYDEIFRRVINPDKFVKDIQFDLELGDVRNMPPEMLGKIMCSFEIGDVSANKKELFDGVSFNSGCEEMLRELVSLCLAYVIRDRLDDRFQKDYDNSPRTVDVGSLE